MKNMLFLCILLILSAALISLRPEAPIVQAQSTLSGEPFHCVVAATTVVALTAVGGACGLPATDQSLFITDIIFSTNSAGVAADSFPTLKYGLTTATVTVFWGAMTPAAAQANAVQDLTTPIRIPAGNQLYFINSTAGSKFLIIDGVKGSGL